MRYLLVAILAAFVLLAPTTAHAQRTPVLPDGRPEFCIALTIAADQAAAEDEMQGALDYLGYSATRGVGLRLMNAAQRAAGWLFYWYSQDTVHWAGAAQGDRDFTNMVEALINTQDGRVATMNRTELASFNRAVQGCQAPRGRS